MGSRRGLCAVTKAPGADWPQWLGPNRNSTTSEIVTPWTDTPNVVWKQKVTRAYSSPIVVEGVAILHSAVEGEESEEVLALKADTGEKLWSDRYPRSRYRSMFGAGPRTTPTAVDGKLVTYGITGVLSCYDIKAGKRLWQTNPYEEYKGTLPRYGVCSSPVIADGRVIVMVGGGGSAVAAYDLTTGELAWKVLDEPASSSSLVAFGRGEETDIVIQTTLRVAGLSPTDGSVKWEHPLVFQPSGVSPTPLAIGQSLIVTTQDTGTMSLLFPTGTASATPKAAWWKQDATSYFSTGSVGPKDTVLVITNLTNPLPRADITCFDVARGDQLWKKENQGYFHAGLILLGDGKVLMLSDGGSLTLAEVTREGMTPLAKSTVSGGTLTNPALSNSRLYVRDEKEILCLQLPTITAATPAETK